MRRTIRAGDLIRTASPILCPRAKHIAYPDFATGTSMGVLLRIIAFAVLVTISSSAVAAQPVYPKNPLVLNDGIYVSANGVERIDRATLTTIWRALDESITFEPVATATAILVGSTSGVYALARESGEILWHVDSAEPLFSPAVLAGIAYVAGQDGSLRAVKVATGASLWNQEFDGWLYTPAIASGRLVVGGSGGVLHGVDMYSGDVIWETEFAQEFVYWPVDVSGRRVVVTAFDGSVQMVSADDGRILWRQYDRVASTSPIVHEGLLYLAQYDGAITVRSVHSGDLVWSKKLAQGLPYPPSLSGELLLAAEPAGKLAVLHRKNGAKLWVETVDSELATAPVIVDGRLIAFSYNGKIRYWPILAISEKP